jgi:hypothetical protein
MNKLFREYFCQKKFPEKTWAKSGFGRFQQPLPEPAKNSPDPQHCCSAQVFMFVPVQIPPA